MAPSSRGAAAAAAVSAADRVTNAEFSTALDEINSLWKALEECPVAVMKSTRPHKSRIREPVAVPDGPAMDDDVMGIGIGIGIEGEARGDGGGGGPTEAPSRDGRGKTAESRSLQGMLLAGKKRKGAAAGSSGQARPDRRRYGRPGDSSDEEEGRSGLGRERKRSRLLAGDEEQLPLQRRKKQHEGKQDGLDGKDEPGHAGDGELAAVGGEAANSEPGSQGTGKKQKKKKKRTKGRKTGSSSHG